MGESRACQNWIKLDLRGRRGKTRLIREKHGGPVRLGKFYCLSLTIMSKRWSVYE